MKTNEKKQPKLSLAYCGNDCTKCPRYVATQSGDVEQLKDVAALWYRVGYRDRIVSPEEISCEGCGSATWCRWGIKECAEGRGVANCGACDDYPCARVQKAFDSQVGFTTPIEGRCFPEDFARLDSARNGAFAKKQNLERARKEYLARRRD